LKGKELEMFKAPLRVANSINLRARYPPLLFLGVSSFLVALTRDEMLHYDLMPVPDQFVPKTLSPKIANVLEITFVSGKVGHKVRVHTMKYL
jgi:hypothetical protein